MVLEQEERQKTTTYIDINLIKWQQP